MVRAVYFVFFLVIATEFGNALSVESACPDGSSSTSAGKLRYKLLCDYDPSVRSTKSHKNATTVAFNLGLKYLRYDHFSHMLSVDAWFIATWTDEHLKWKPEDHDDITYIKMMAQTEIWVPDISIYNRHDQSTDPKVITDAQCSVSNTGNVLCVPGIHFDTLCVPNLKKYPYDTQICTIRFGSWVYKGEELKLKTLNPVVDSSDLEEDLEWSLVSFKSVYHRGNYSCCPNSTYPSVDIILEVKRNSNSHSINVVLPLIVCIMITLTTMAMSPLNKDRFLLSCVSVVGHILHVQNVFYTIPAIGDDLPSLLTISRDSTLLAGIGMIATVLLKSMMESKSPSPTWMSLITSVLIGSRPGQLIFLADSSLKGAAAAQKQEDGNTIINNIETPTSSSLSSDWFIFAKFLDVLLFASYILAYIVILLSF